MGGEKFYDFEVFKFDWGSPPRGRGKVDCYPYQPGPMGITPAWAGKSVFRALG